MEHAFKGSWIFVGVLVAALMGCAGSGEKTGAYVDDSWITTKVKSEMIANKEVAANKIEVTTTNGVVLLAGTAESAQAANKAVEIARGIEGVRSVDNRIRIQ